MEGAVLPAQALARQAIALDAGARTLAGAPRRWAGHGLAVQPLGSKTLRMSSAKLLVDRQGVTVEIEMGAGNWTAILPSVSTCLAPEAARAAEPARRGAQGRGCGALVRSGGEPGGRGGTATDLNRWIESGTLWAAAREWKRAIPALRHALRLSRSSPPLPSSRPWARARRTAQQRGHRGHQTRRPGPDPSFYEIPRAFQRHVRDATDLRQPVEEPDPPTPKTPRSDRRGGNRSEKVVPTPLENLRGK